MSRRELFALASLLLVGAVGWTARREYQQSAEALRNEILSDAPAIAPPSTPELETFRRTAEAITPLFSKLPPTQPGDWLARHVEFGQTLDQFLIDRREKVCDAYRRICVVQLGDMSDSHRRLSQETAEFLALFFGLPVETLDPAGLDDVPSDSQRVRPASGSRQVRTAHLLTQVLLPRRPDDAAVVVGLTEIDLWDGDFDFLFGQGSAKQRVCVCSFARLGDVEAGDVTHATCLRRIAGLAAHEIGHVFGLPHCIAWSCRMNGSNHLEESDRRPLEFCPECLPKIWWTCGLDPQDRFDRLLDFAERQDLTRGAALWRAATERLVQLRESSHDE